MMKKVEIKINWIQKSNVEYEYSKYLKGIKAQMVK